MNVTAEFDTEFAAPADWARMYRGLGLQVVPAANPDPAPGAQWKRPIINWLEWRNTRTPDSLFGAWYGPRGTELRRRNMGLICGAASGKLVVVDLDTQKGPEAGEYWRGLLAVHNNGMQPDTWVQVTGGGGLQFFFTAPEGWTPPTFKAPSVHVDVRGQGGFVMCPPSLHTSGKPYEWEPGYEPWACELAEMPMWLCEALDKLRLEHGGQAPGEKREQVAPEGEKNAFGLDTNGREDKLLRAVWGAVVDLRRDCPIPPAQAVQEAEILRVWGNYERTTKTRLTVAASNADGLEAEGRGLSELRRKWAYAMGQWDTRVAEAARVPRPTEPAADEPAAGALVVANDELPAPPLIRVSEWAGEPPERRWVLREWIVQGSVNSLYGDGGLGKTLLAQQLAYAVSIGAPFLGIETAKGAVLAVLCEDDEGELMRRHAAIKASLGYPVGNPFNDVWLWPRVGAENTLVRFDKTGLPILGSFYADLVAKIAAINPSLLVLDTLADLYGGNELDRPQVNYFVKTILGGLIRSQAAAGHSLTILLLGHPSVSGMGQGGRGYSGSSAWNNAVRSRLYLTRPEDEHGDVRVLTRGKANYAKSGDETAIRLMYVDGVLVAEPNETGAVSAALEVQIKSRVRDAFDMGQPYVSQRGHRRNVYELLPRQLEAVGYDPRAAISAIGRMIREGELKPKRYGRDGNQGLAVTQ